MIIAWQVAGGDRAGRQECRALERAEAHRMAEIVGPTHLRASAEHFAALPDGRAAAAVMTLAVCRILSCDLTD